MLCDILVLEINLNKNFQTCTTMAPLCESVRTIRTLNISQSEILTDFLFKKFPQVNLMLVSKHPGN